MRIVTAGVYGHSEESFFDAVANAGIDIFVDTRRRRAVRGHQYAFANSNRLQAGLAEIGVSYVHRLDLAPTKEMVKRQDTEDHAQHIRRSDRDHLSQALIDGYQRLVLDGLDSRELVESLGDPSNSILIFCVERTPEACHRSLLARKLADDLGAEVEHILPPE